MKYFGHWIAADDFDPNDHIGFVYLVRLDNGKYYVGSKRLWVSLDRAPSTFKRRKKPFKESEWKSYTTSSKYINEQAYLDNVSPVEFRIIAGFPTWGKTLFVEFMLQIMLNALLDENSYNEYAEGQFTKNSIVEDWKQYVDIVISLLKSKAMHKPKPFKITNGNKIINVTNSWGLAESLHCLPSDLERLRVGHLLSINNEWTLVDSQIPQHWVDGERKFYSIEEIKTHFSLPTLAAAKRKAGTLKEVKKETKQEFIDRISS